MPESSRDRVVRRAREATVAQGYRSYATLVAEHERLRRQRWVLKPDAHWEPSPAAWHTLRFLADVHDPSRRAARVLREALEGQSGPAPEGSDQSAIGNRKSAIPPLPWKTWRKALRAGIELVADVLVKHGAELPWGRGRPRVPRKRDDFDAACRFLRDLSLDDDGPPLAEILDAVEVPPLPEAEPPADHRVTFYRGRQTLSIDGVCMSLPMGRELAFLTLLWERRRRGEVTPPMEHDVNWKNAADQLRARIRRATGHNLLRAVVLPALAPVGGYRLAPGVHVRND